MGCGCPTSFNDKNLKKASNPTAETHRESGFAADSMMDETPKKLN